ncbi:MAG: SAM-dependent methyltransferase [Bacteroidota bacterium]
MKSPSHNKTENHSYGFLFFFLSSGLVKMEFPQRVLVFVLILLISGATQAQDVDIPYVPTPTAVVRKMLDIADVGPGDYLIDLGSGDGRIVIDAARRGAVGHGVEIDHDLVREAEDNARSADVSDKVIFLEEDVFDTDFSRASVVTMYLMNIVNIELRPELLDKLSPGTRIVSHSFGMEDWKPDKHIKEGDHDIYYWVVPAKIEGQWRWKVNGKQFTMSAEQEFQETRLELYTENDTLEVRDHALAGKRVNFTAVHPDSSLKYVYHGQVKGEEITGKVQIIENETEYIENWSATVR